MSLLDSGLLMLIVLVVCGLRLMAPYMGTGSITQKFLVTGTIAIKLMVESGFQTLKILWLSM